jgi:V8-like Glu-specific endopeptidase
MKTLRAEGPRSVGGEPRKEELAMGVEAIERERLGSAFHKAFPEAFGDGPLTAPASVTFSRIQELGRRLEGGDVSRALIDESSQLIAAHGFAVHGGVLASRPPIQATREITTAEARAHIDETRASLDLEEWLSRLERIKAQVCKIWYNSYHGTGFLVAPNIIMTNWHMVDAVISGPVLPDQVRIQFEHGPPGSRTTRLAPDWLVAWSRRSPMDWKPDPKPREASMRELDYALLRLRDAPGVERGFIEIPRESSELHAGAALHIVEYPKGGQLQIALQPNSILRVNQARTRVRYETYTDDGASGAPCFDKDWHLVALHRGSDPDWTRRPQFSEGIPIATIRDTLPQEARRAIGI